MEPDKLGLLVDAQDPELAELDVAAIEKLAAGAELEKIDAASELGDAQLPLRFDDEESEVNFLAVIAALDFGDGWRTSIVALTGRPYEELVTFALMSQHISGDPLSADSLANLSLFNLGNVLNLPITEEVEVAPCIRQDKPSHHKPLVERYYSVLQNIALRLQETGFPSLGRFILHPGSAHAKGKPSGASEPESAASLIARLSGTFACFSDAPTHPGTDQKLPFNRKAATLARRLQSRFPASLPLPGAESLPAGADLQTLRLLVGHNLVTLSNALRAKLVAKPCITANAETEIALRACAAVAVDRLGKALTTRAGREVPPAIALTFLRNLEGEVGEAAESGEGDGAGVRGGDGARPSGDGARPSGDGAGEGDAVAFCRDTSHY